MTTKIERRIALLFRKADNSAVPIAEATALRDKAHELMRKYKVAKVTDPDWVVALVITHPDPIAEVIKVCFSMFAGMTNTVSRVEDARDASTLLVLSGSHSDLVTGLIRFQHRLARQDNPTDWESVQVVRGYVLGWAAGIVVAITGVEQEPETGASTLKIHFDQQSYLSGFADGLAFAGQGIEDLTQKVARNNPIDEKT